MKNDTADFELFLKGKKLNACRNQMFRSIRDRYGLKQAEIEILIYVYNNPGASAAEIAADMILQKGHVSLAKEGLQKRCCIAVTRDEKDRRCERMRITDEGTEICEEIIRQKQQFEAVLLKGFSDREIRQLTELLQKLMSNME